MTLRQKFYLPGQSKSPTSLLMPWTHFRACSSVCISVTLILHLAAISGIAFCIFASLSDVPVGCAKQLAERRKKPSFITNMQAIALLVLVPLVAGVPTQTYHQPAYHQP